VDVTILRINAMGVQAPSGNEPSASNPCPTCPICQGTMELVYDRLNQRVCVCTDCHSGVTVPISAMEVLKLKREKKWGNQE
jgi:hypothetical protein